MTESEKITAKRYKAMAPDIISNLEKRGFEAYFCETSQEAADTILSLIPKDNSVSWGGSVTLNEIGIIDKLKQSGYNIIDRSNAKSNEEAFAVMRQSLLCDTYLSSVNAISEDGVMINIDGTGNRIAAIAFGPKNVIIAVGMNKICKNAELAKIRAREVAAPNNGFRLGLELPCTKTGRCHNCSSPNSMCSQIVEMRRNRVQGRIKVILIGENLGL